MDQQKINIALVQIYKVLQLTPEEIEKTFEDLAGIQQVAASTEILRVLDQNEVNELNGLEQIAGQERAAVLQKIIEKHKNDPGLSARIQASAANVLDEHIAFLQTRGNDEQKARIEQILAGLG